MYSSIILLILVALVAQSLAFTSRWVAPRAASRQALRMSDNTQWDALRAKYQSNPNYNPMADPEAQAMLENLIPNEFRDLNNAIERLRVALTDATTGPDAIENIDTVLSQFTKEELISSPQSQWFRDGRPEPEEPFSEAKLDELTEKAKREYPQVPME